MLHLMSNSHPYVSNLRAESLLSLLLLPQIEIRPLTMNGITNVLLKGILNLYDACDDHIYAFRMCQNISDSK